MSRALIAAGIVLAAALILGGMDRRDAAITAKHVRAAAEKKADVKPADAAWMQVPLACTTWIAKCGAGEVCKRRYHCGPDLTKRAAQ